MIKSTCRIAMTLGLIAVSVIWIAHGLKLIPDTEQNQIDSRLQMCESLAVTTSWFAKHGTEKGLESIVRQIGERSTEVVSIRIMKDARPIAVWGQHPDDWKNSSSEESTANRMSVDILANGEYWGRVQISYTPLASRNSVSAMMLIFFCGAMVALLSWFFLNRALKYLNPSRVVPSRVRNALDVITEGLVLQDNAGQIVMANESFLQIVGKKLDGLMGRTPDDLSWNILAQSAETDANQQPRELPWQTTLRTRLPQKGIMVGRTDANGDDRKFIVNSTPLLEDGGKCRGALTSFEDVSILENKREELSRMLQILKTSRDEIRRQNENLQYLASRDSLTGCFNRRCFFEQIDQLWNKTADAEMSVIMLDIDHFKTINDNFGHAVGDQVIKTAAEMIKQIVGKRGIVCRYGGEEFCVALPRMDFSAALELAEAIRSEVDSKPIANVDVTLSIGVSSREFLAMDPQHMLEQADQSLYVAKNNGRNRVVGWDTCSRGVVVASENEPGKTIHGDTAGLIQPIENEAVLGGLYSALYYRDQQTALHSARVANLATAAARSVIDEPVVKVLEVASLLHDIGKIGIPDSVLRKPARLEGYEIHLMQRRESIANAICRSARVSIDVATVVANYLRHYRQGDGFATLTTAQPRLSICCRILAICDALDSMISVSDYRDARSIAEAIYTLKHCSPEQFDPELVDLVDKTIVSQPECLYPLNVPGANLDDSFLNNTVDIFTAAEAGNLEPLRLLMKRLKREAVSEDEGLHESISQLEMSLIQNDEEVQSIVQTTRELLELCRANREKRLESDDYQPFGD